MYNNQKKNNDICLKMNQLMYLINQKSSSICEKNLEEINSQITKIKENTIENVKKSKKLLKFTLNGNQQLNPGQIDRLISSLFSYIKEIHLQFTRVDPLTIIQITENGQNIEYIGLKGCYHLQKDILLSICKSKTLSKQFRLGCVFELKHLIDYEVLTALASSKYMTNILSLDLSGIQVPNMDDCIMNICFIAQDICINLRIINVENTLISDRGFQMISVSQKFKNLERIYFKGCPLITERGVSFIVDSNNLTRFDLSHFLGQNSDLLNGRIIDTLKYSNRRIFFRVKYSISFNLFLNQIYFIFIINQIYNVMIFNKQQIQDQIAFKRDNKVYKMIKNYFYNRRQISFSLLFQIKSCQNYQTKHEQTLIV